MLWICPWFCRKRAFLSLLFRTVSALPGRRSSRFWSKLSHALDLGHTSSPFGKGVIAYTGSVCKAAVLGSYGSIIIICRSSLREMPVPVQPTVWSLYPDSEDAYDPIGGGCDLPVRIVTATSCFGSLQMFCLRYWLFSCQGAARTEYALILYIVFRDGKRKSSCKICINFCSMGP